MIFVVLFGVANDTKMTHHTFNYYSLTRLFPRIISWNDVILQALHQNMHHTALDSLPCLLIISLG